MMAIQQHSLLSHQTDVIEVYFKSMIYLSIVILDQLDLLRILGFAVNTEFLASEDYHDCQQDEDQEHCQ